MRRGAIKLGEGDLDVSDLAFECFVVGVVEEGSLVVVADAEIFLWLAIDGGCGFADSDGLVVDLERHREVCCKAGG